MLFRSPQQYRLVLHGMVDRPMVYSLEDLKSLPSESRIHFLECIANSAPGGHGGRKESVESVQDIHGRTSCSEWTGVPLSVLLEAAGVQKGASWIVSEGGDSGRYSYSLPLEKAKDDVLVVYGQNGGPLRPEQGYPLRLIAPGWEAPFNVKWLRQIKVVDRPYMTKFETVVHAYLRPDLKGKARWFDFEMPPKSVILRPPAGRRYRVRDFTRSAVWPGRAEAPFAASRSPPMEAGAGKTPSCRSRCFEWRIRDFIWIGAGMGKRPCSCRAAPMSAATCNHRWMSWERPGEFPTKPLGMQPR